MINKIKEDLVKLDKYLLTKMIDLDVLDRYELKNILSISKERYRSLAYRFDECNEACKDVQDLFKEIDLKMEKVKLRLKAPKYNWSQLIKSIIDFVKKYFSGD